tara:strand:- start:3034 stop:4728 length:1695 start_codon:yes stop_codon:yes gene_type:complete
MSDTTTDKWILRNPKAPLERIAHYPKIVGTVLAARGITTPEDAQNFYRPEEAPKNDPFLLPDISSALLRLDKAISDSEIIALFGDFDVDGITSIAVLKIGLEQVGAKLLTYLPDRFTEGYGLNRNAVHKLAKQGASVLITADCGTSSVEEIALANKLGIDVIVIDHHTVPEKLPPALAVINPKRPDSLYPFREMAAVGVAFRFLESFFASKKITFPANELIDLVALGTVVDVAPLIDENRTIVKAGLEIMTSQPRTGILSLSQTAKIKNQLSAEQLAFALGPRLNAAGRLAHASLAFDLLTTSKQQISRELSEKLETLNLQRRKECKEAHLLAEELAGSTTDPLIMVGSNQIHAGIIGIVAARLAESRKRPAIVYERQQDESRASARSIPQFDIVKAIRKESSLLERYGGHRAAAGFTIRNENVETFREKIINTAAELMESVDLRGTIEIDAEATLGNIKGSELRGLLAFEPCGHSNPKPVLFSKNVQLIEKKRVGSEQEHLRLKIKDGGITWQGIAFGKGDLELTEQIDIVYSLKKGWYERTEIEVFDACPSGLRDIENRIES